MLVCCDPFYNKLDNIFFFFFVFLQLIQVYTRPRRYSYHLQVHFLNISYRWQALNLNKFHDNLFLQCILEENLARRAEHYFSEMKRVVKGELITFGVRSCVYLIYQWKLLPHGPKWTGVEPISIYAHPKERGKTINCICYFYYPSVFYSTSTYCLVLLASDYL